MPCCHAAPSVQFDCVRIFSDTRQQILQRVPADTQLIRKIGSDAPAAMLFDAMENFANGDAKGACLARWRAVDGSLAAQ